MHLWMSKQASKVLKMEIDLEAIFEFNTMGFGRRLRESEREEQPSRAKLEFCEWF